MIINYTLLREKNIALTNHASGQLIGVYSFLLIMTGNDMKSVEMNGVIVDWALIDLSSRKLLYY
jgi:hypothetical protein